MEFLGQRLKEEHARRMANQAWESFDAATKVLNNFRAQAHSGMLKVCTDGQFPYYSFDPRGASPADAAWEKLSGFVLAVIQSSTELKVKWGGSKCPIELHLVEPAECGKVAKIPAAAPETPAAAPQVPAVAPHQPIPTTPIVIESQNACERPDNVGGDP